MTRNPKLPPLQPWEHTPNAIIEAANRLAEAIDNYTAMELVKVHQLEMRAAHRNPQDVADGIVFAMKTFRKAMKS